MVFGFPATSWGHVRLRREGYADADLGEWARSIGENDWTDVYVFNKHEDEGTGPRGGASLRGDVRGHIVSGPDGCPCASATCSTFRVLAAGAKETLTVPRSECRGGACLDDARRTPCAIFFAS